MNVAETIWNNLTQHEIDDRDIQAQTHYRNKKVVDEDYYERDFLRKGVEEIIPDLELV